MKKILFILFLLFSVSKNSNGQPNYITNNSLDKFTGIWQWANGVDTVKIFLRKEKITTGGNHEMDAIVGFHIYKRGNTVIEDSYSLRNNPHSLSLKTILGGNTEGSSLMSGSLKDISKNKPIKINLELDASLTALTWHIYIGGTQVNEIPGITLPTDLVLIRQ